MKKRLAILLVLLPACAAAQSANPPTPASPPPPPEATEVWSPVPPKVEPAQAPGQPPSDAIVLFNGKDLSNWESVDGGPAEWKVENGELVDVPKAGHIRTRQKFGDCQLHVEWMVPVLPADRKGQDRGNSGVFLQGLYEVQVLDTYNNPTYVNGEAGAIYKQSAPLVNALKPAPQWQSYDIVYYAPRFHADGSVAEPARITVFLNGILVQSNFAIRGPTDYRILPVYHAHGEAGLMLQAHNNPVHFRNIWIRRL
ncbi:MAG TPA: DUF1080 domain-containing protein [Rhizomicrobium sp.]|nr:DUF1080 domain-containing protein [Rhizomicrobium sp.]